MTSRAHGAARGGRNDITELMTLEGPAPLLDIATDARALGQELPAEAFVLEPAVSWQQRDHPWGALLHPSSSPGDNAFYLLAMVTALDHSGSPPVSLVAPGGCSGHTPRTPAELQPWAKDPGPFYKELASLPLAWEGDTEEELLQICASDLLLGSSLRKRPRLLPPHRKMHVEVWKRKAASPQLEEDVRSPVPLEYSHLVDAMAMTELADISEVESFYRQFTPWPRRRGSCRSSRGAHAHSASTSPAREATEAPGRGCEPPPKSNRKRGLASVSTLLLAAKRPMDNAWSAHLPPKKRYIQY
nr:uncharacterized protein LOC106732902 [Pelodiscus sinensis]|eukprot:XP_025033886.1 uncharacterized protein LOC106732902 [Pelodiscus sinensis]